MTTTRNRVSALGALLVAVVMPFALQSPAQAATTRNACTVGPLAPVFEGKFDSRGKKIVNYPISVKCDGGRDVVIEQQFLERNISNGLPVYSYQGSASHSRTALWGWWLAETIRSERTLPYADSNGDDEVLHKVRFRVRSGGVTGSVSSWEFSPVRSITH